MNDDQMDDMLIEGVRDYNAPRSVPREEMWKRIAEARAAQRVVAVPPRRETSAGLRWFGLAAAAAAILVTGVILGRSLDRASVVAPQVAQGPQVPKTSAPVKGDTVIEQLRRETGRTDQQVRELAAAPARDTERSSGGSSASSRTIEPRSRQNLAYQLVVLRHLAGSEAMITAFRSGARGGEVDAQLASWSKELLSTTRLLESTAAADDPVMKRLLEDLDLVISQIVQYTTRGTTNTEDLDLIEQTIKRRGVITKLRSTNPGRGVAAGL